ncbi:MAG: hypothetical protein ACRD3L_09815 [Terriglobales bacterium]
MKQIILVMVFVTSLLVVSLAMAQDGQVRHERRPAAAGVPSPANQPAPNYDFFSILDGQPKGLELHHDTVAGSGMPVDVFVFPIELQVVNSDGNFEPEGLIIDNFYTAKPVQPQRAPNPHNARDCRIWNSLILNEMQHDPQGSTWSYIEFTVARGARTVQTNEDGLVWWSDDVECWGARDRFAPF